MIESNAGNIDIKFKCRHDGNLKITLRGKDVRNADNKRVPVYINYTDFTVDDENIVQDGKIVWHDEPFAYTKKVKNGQIVKLHLEWNPADINN